MTAKFKKIFIFFLCLVMCISLFPTADAAVSGGDLIRSGNWSNGWEWWSQNQSQYEWMRRYGCNIVAEAKMLVETGIASSNPSVFNPDIYYAWCTENGYVVDGGNLRWDVPSLYADTKGKSLDYLGTTSNLTQDEYKAKIWENINSNIYTQLWFGNHYVYVNNAASKSSGEIKIYQSWYFKEEENKSYNIPGTEALNDFIYNMRSFSAAADIGDDFYGVILNTNCWKPISQVEGSALISLQKENGTSRQLWRFERQDNGDYVIYSCYDGKVLEMHNGERTNGTQLCTHSDFWGGMYQQWRLIPYGDGYIFESEHFTSEEWVMDLYMYGTSDGTKIGIWRRDNTTAQIWSVYKNDDVQLKAPTLAVNASDESQKTKFTWNNVYGETQFNLKIWKNKVSGDPDYTKSTTATSCELQLPAGTYQAYVEAENYYQTKRSNIVTFTVKNSAYTVTFDPNGGKVSPASMTTGTDGKLSSLPVPTRSGYIFDGWYSGNTKVSVSTVFTANTTVTAKWLAIYTITYNANGGTDAPPSQTVNGGPTVLSNDIPVRKHHTFLGWAVTDDAASAAYQPGETYSGGTDITLYAIWQRDLEKVMILPKELSRIESEAFIGTDADAFVVPGTVSAIGDNAFDDVAIYGYKGSYAESYADANGLTFIPLDDQWVRAENVPVGAHVTDEKWTYTKATEETTQSTATSMPGWKQTGYKWQKTGSGVWKYANYPSGFDTGDILYSRYNKSALKNSSTATTKRDVGSSSLYSYIYWHWTHADKVEEANRNVLINDKKEYGVHISGSVYRDFIFFDAFESTTSLSPEGMTNNGLKSFEDNWSTYHHPEYNLPEYASWWWYRFEVMQQSYTDYEKLFTYVRTGTEDLESAVEVKPGDNITNIQHWVKYSF